jgi:hypothetical protein
MLRRVVGAVLVAVAAAIAVFLVSRRGSSAADRFASTHSKYSDVGAVIAADAPVVIKPNDPNLFYIGRWRNGTDPSFKTLDWGGSTIRMRITGTKTLGVALLVRAQCCMQGRCHFWLRTENVFPSHMSFQKDWCAQPCMDAGEGFLCLTAPIMCTMAGRSAS